jgi:hypothetical protein
MTGPELMAIVATIVLPRGSQFAAALEPAAGSVVVWSPAEHELPSQLRLPCLTAAILRHYRPEVRFGRIEVWRRATGLTTTAVSALPRTDDRPALAVLAPWIPSRIMADARHRSRWPRSKLRATSHSMEAAMDAWFTGFLCLLIIGYVYFTPKVLNQLARFQGRLSRLEAKLDLLLKNAGIAFDPVADLPPPVVEALQRGDKIQAIKHYRDATGADLVQAKEFIEEVQRRAGPDA